MQHRLLQNTHTTITSPQERLATGITPWDNRGETRSELSKDTIADQPVHFAALGNPKFHENIPFEKLWCVCASAVF